jgi:hypothetical protein
VGERAARLSQLARRPIPIESYVVFRESILGGVANIEDVDRVAVDREQNAVNVWPTTVKQFPKVDAEIGRFVGLRTPFRGIRQRLNSRKNAGVPTRSGSCRDLMC